MHAVRLVKACKSPLQTIKYCTRVVKRNPHYLMATVLDVCGRLTGQRDCHHKMATRHELDELWQVVYELIRVRDEVLWKDKHLPSAFNCLHRQIILNKEGEGVTVHYIMRT